MKLVNLFSAAVFGTVAVFSAAAWGHPISPLVPFVIPSGRPSEAEIRAQVRDLKSHGFDQFLVYSSTGLDYEYLGEDFLRMTQWYLDEARARGMKVWLYDEFNWPSGTARGRVPAENEAARYRELVVKRRPQGGFEWEIVVSNDINVDNYCLDGNNFEPVSVNRFMELTHHQYERRFKEDLGTVIRGIFTDEPGHCSSAWRMKMPEGTALRFPYWSGLEDEYRALCGGDFRAEVEAALVNGKKARERVFRLWGELRSRRYRRTYFDPITAWCATNGIVSTGHLFAEGSPQTCTRINGTPLNTLKGLAKPGIDLIYSNFENPSYEWLTLAFLQSAAQARGCGGSVELFALGPCDISFARMRFFYWLCALHGADTFFQSLYHTTARRFNVKDSWAMFTSPTQPWYGELPLLHEEAKKAAAYARKPHRCELAVVYPAAAGGAAALTGDAAECPDLAGLAGALTTNGFTYELIEEGASTAKRYVLDWDGKTLLERRSGTRFADFAAALAWLDGKAGTREANTIKREYADGSVVRINLKTGEIAFVAAEKPEGAAARGKADLPVGEWELVLDGPSKRRVWFWRSKVKRERLFGVGQAEEIRDASARYEADDMTKFVCERELKGVRFVLRDYPEGCGFRVTLDGRELRFPVAPAKSLVYAYNEICRESEPLDLSAGEHVLKLEGGHDGKMFLPVLWLVGDFAERTYGRLGSLPRRVPCGSLASQGLGSFAGTATYRTETSFAAEDRLTVDSGGAVVRVRFGGRDLGARGWAPFEWEIPGDLVGRRLSLEIDVITSVRPIFGSDKSPDAKLDHALWVPTTFVDPSPVGLRSVGVKRSKCE